MRRRDRRRQLDRERRAADAEDRGRNRHLPRVRVRRERLGWYQHDRRVDRAAHRRRPVARAHLPRVLSVEPSRKHALPRAGSLSLEPTACDKRAVGVRATFVLAAVGLWAWSAPAWALNQRGTAFEVNTYTPNNQINPAVAGLID